MVLSSEYIKFWNKHTDPSKLSLETVGATIYYKVKNEKVIQGRNRD